MNPKFGSQTLLYPKSGDVGRDNVLIINLDVGKHCHGQNGSKVIAQITLERLKRAYSKL